MRTTPQGANSGRTAGTRRSPRSGWPIAAALACVALALWMHRRVLEGFFTLDDLILLEQARGLRPDFFTLWRWLPHAYFRAGTALFGVQPLPWHVVSWLLHGLNAALLFLWVRRWGGSTLAAAVAAGLFGTSRLLMTAIYAPSSLGELLALGLTLSSFLAAMGRGAARRAAAAALYCAALLSKESVLPLPLVLLLPAPETGGLRERAGRAAPLFLLGAAFAAYLMLSGSVGSHLGGPAYAVGFGAVPWRNLVTYGLWATDLGSAIPGTRELGSAADWIAGLAVTAGLPALALASRRATGVPALGACWWLLGIAPVLPLLHHSYLHYLYAPLAGLAMAVGGGLDWWRATLAAREKAGGGPAPRRADRRPAPVGRAVLIAGVVLIAVHALVSDRLLELRGRLLMPDRDLPLDPYLRRCEMARRVSAGVGRAVDGRRVKIVFLLPRGTFKIQMVTTGIEAAHPESVSVYHQLKSVVDDGRALRLIHPSVDSVAFIDRWVPGYEDFEVFFHGGVGNVADLGRGAQALRRAGGILIQSRLDAPARDLLAGAVAAYPEDPELRWQYGLALTSVGDDRAARTQFEALLRQAPGDTISALAREALQRMDAGNR